MTFIGADLPDDGVPLSALRRDPLPKPAPRRDPPRPVMVTPAPPGARATRVRLLMPDIVADYLDGVRVNLIRSEHRISSDELYATLRLCGVRLRHAAPPWRLERNGWRGARKARR